MTAPTQGYISAATNSAKHVQMAVDLRLSLREHDPSRPFTLITDASQEAYARSFDGVFDGIVVIEPRYNWGFAPKIYACRASPYDHTLLLDADILALGPLDALWSMLAEIPFCIPGKNVGPDCSGHHHNYPIRYLMNQFALSRYYWAIAPMFFFRRDGRALVEEVMRVYFDELPAKGIEQWDWKPVPPDEIAFGVVGGRTPFHEFPPLQTIINQRDLARWRVDSPPHPLFHCTMGPPLAVLAGLMRQVQRRRDERGFAQGSRRYWVRKALVKRTQQALTRALGLPWNHRLRR